MTVNIEIEDNWRSNCQKEEVFTLMDYNNLDFSKEKEIYYNSNTEEVYGPSDIEIKVR